MLHASLSLLCWLATAPGGSAEQAAGISHRTRLYDVAVHGRDIFVVGHPGVVLRSSDQGQQFARVNVPTTDALFSIDINKAGVGAIVGRGGLVLLTSDGGTTWTKTNAHLHLSTQAGAEEKPHLFAVDVLDGGAIVAAGDFGVIVHSPDGGKTWARRSFDATDQIRAAPIGAGGGAPKAVPSGDGIPGSADHDNAGAEGQARLTGISFGDDRNGFVVGEFGLVLASKDGGLSWKRQKSGTTKLLFSVHAISPTRALAAGSDGTVLETGDGGASWAVLPTGTSRHLFGVWASADVTLVTGADGLILLRAAGGSGPFQAVKTGAYTWLAAAAFLDSKHGVVVGGRGHLFATGDGGQTFRLLMGQ
jgi:photosystem II stability/assembly factor-like uncharacterized protein